jgi:hypothetical protein
MQECKRLGLPYFDKHPMKYTVEEWRLIKAFETFFVKSPRSGWTNNGQNMITNPNQRVLGDFRN